MRILKQCGLSADADAGANTRYISIVNGMIMICDDVDVLCLRGWQFPCFFKILPEIIY